VPGFWPDVTPWATVALTARAAIVGDEPQASSETLGPTARSLGWVRAPGEHPLGDGRSTQP